MFRHTFTLLIIRVLMRQLSSLQRDTAQLRGVSIRGHVWVVAYPEAVVPLQGVYAFSTFIGH